MAPVYQLGEVSWLDGICSMLPYGTGICCYALIYFLLCFNCFCVFLSNTFLKSGIDKLTEWSMIPACPALCAV